jgi:hypothetical protein
MHWRFSLPHAALHLFRDGTNGTAKGFDTASSLHLGLLSKGTQITLTFCCHKFSGALLIASKEIGLEVNAEKTKYMVMSRDQNAGQNEYTQIGNKSFETVKQFKYLGTTITNQNSIHEEIKSRLKSGNV